MVVVGGGAGGGLFIWGLPIVVAGQVLVALIFAELAVIYPMAGALYQWARRLIGPRYGWLVGTTSACSMPPSAWQMLTRSFIHSPLGLRRMGLLLGVADHHRCGGPGRCAVRVGDARPSPVWLGRRRVRLPP